MSLSLLSRELRRSKCGLDRERVPWVVEITPSRARHADSNAGVSTTISASAILRKVVNPLPLSRGKHRTTEISSSKSS